MASSGCHLCYWLTYYRLKIPTTPSLCLTTLPVQLTELRKTFYLLDHWFITHGYNSGSARWKRCTRQGMWEQAWSFRAPLSVPLSPVNTIYQLKSFINPMLWSFIKWARLIKSLAKGDWGSIFSPSPLPGGEGVGKKVPALLGRVYCQPEPPSLGTFQ